MAHQLVTQVDEGVDADDSECSAGSSGRSSSPRSIPGGCWRTFWSFFSSAASSSGGSEKGSPSSKGDKCARSALSLVPLSTSGDSPVPRPAHSTPTPFSSSLLPERPSGDCSRARKCLVLDLDETLVHSSFKPIPNPDFVLEIELDGTKHRVFVRKRPGVDFFLRWAAERFELVIFTASLAKYADPLLDVLDPHRTISFRLFRESCVFHYGNYVKDLTHLGRAIDHVFIIDNSPFSYLFQPENAMPCTSWFHDRADLQLYEMLPFLEKLAACSSVIPTLSEGKASGQYTFFGPTREPPNIVVPYDAYAATNGSGSEQGAQQEGIQLQVGIQ